MSNETKKILIKNGTLADGRVCDVLIENGLIQSVAQSLSDSEASIFDATSMIVMSGLVDLHTHLREPGMDMSHSLPWPTLLLLPIMLELLSRFID